jgi:hypothetical protein
MIIYLEPFTRELLSDDYEGDGYFRVFYIQMKEILFILMEGNEYRLQDGLLYKLAKLCIP